MSSLKAYALAATACVPAASAAVLDMPIWFRNTYAAVEVNIGTPPSSHLLRFDTGSATSWVVDQDCAEGCDNYSGFPRTGYNASASETSGALGTYGVIEYFGGNTEGPGVYDQWTGPPSELSWNQTFLAANLSSWAQTAADGFLGLAFSTISVAEAPTVVETLLWDGQLDEPRFGIYYGQEWRNTGDAGDAPGEGVLTFGGSHEDKYVADPEKDVTWVPLVLREWETEYQVWRTELASFSAQTGENDSQEIDLANNYVVFDTGAGGISVPESQVDAMYEAIGMNYRDILENGYVPLCTDFNSSWSVSFHFRGDGGAEDVRTLTLTGDQLARPGFAGDREDACWPPFEGGNDDGFFLIGTPLLHHFYTVWDFGADAVENYKPRIGFGKLKADL